MADDIFGDKPLNDSVTTETLVGEGRKYSSTDELAKAYANVEDFAETLKRELAVERAKNDASRMTERQEQPRSGDQPVTPPAETPKPQIETKDLRELVTEVMRDVDTSRKFESNVEITAQKMIEVYGSAGKAQQAVIDKARELGVNPEWLRDAAARSPQAFYATMGINPEVIPTNRETPAPRSEVRLPSSGNNQKNFAYFQELRKTNKTQYYSTETQAEMQRLAREQGDAFYS